MENKNIWVIIELDDDNKIKKVSLELLSIAYDLSNKLSEKIEAIIIGSDIKDCIEELKYYNIDNIIAVEDEKYKSYNVEMYSKVLEILSLKYKPNAVLIGASSKGRDYAPRLAAKLKTGLTADCTEILIDENNEIIWSRPTFGGNLMAEIICPDKRPQMGTVREGIFKDIRLENKLDIPVILENIEIDDNIIRTRIIETIKNNFKDDDIKDSEIIIGIGRGIENQKNIDMIYELAKLINAKVACSRALVEMNLMPHIYQVGQSGKTITAKKYIAIGISGAIQHLTGISSCETIIAINKDPNANIFTIADYSIIGDLNKIVPKLIEEIKSKR